jgi:hypothetical protein
VRRLSKLQGMAALLVLLSAPALAKDDPFERMMRGESAMPGKELERAVATADEHPLGSRENPVRVSRPQGQRAYLARLRCADGKVPAFERAGNLGPGVFGNIVDLYVVECAGSEPASSEVVMDMYHLGRTEDRAVPGFTIAGTGTTKPRPAGLPTGAPPPPTAPVQTRVQEPTG